MAYTDIPGPRGRLLLGNIGDIDPDNMMLSLCSLTETYGQSFALLWPDSGSHA